MLAILLIVLAVISSATAWRFHAQHVRYVQCVAEARTDFDDLLDKLDSNAFAYGLADDRAIQSMKTLEALPLSDQQSVGVIGLGFELDTIHECRKMRALQFAAADFSRCANKERQDVRKTLDDLSSR